MRGGQRWAPQGRTKTIMWFSSSPVGATSGRLEPGERAGHRGSRTWASISSRRPTSWTSPWRMTSPSRIIGDRCIEGNVWSCACRSRLDSSAGRKACEQSGLGRRACRMRFGRGWNQIWVGMQMVRHSCSNAPEAIEDGKPHDREFAELPLLGREAGPEAGAGADRTPTTGQGPPESNLSLNA